jgi:hypothetical protein
LDVSGNIRSNEYGVGRESGMVNPGILLLEMPSDQDEVLK